MARKHNERYVRYYTFGSAAAKLENAERRAALPEYKNNTKRKPIAFDPVSALGSVVAVVLAVLMIVGIAQVAFTAAQVRDIQADVTALEIENEMLREKYAGSYDLNEVRAAAEAMGMIPADQAVRVSVAVPAQPVETATMSWWDSFLVSLRQLFA